MMANPSAHRKLLSSKSLATELRRAIPLFSLGIVFIAGAYGQTASLILSAGQALPSATAVLNLSLTSLPGSEPTAIYWKLTYNPGLVSAISATAGPTAVAASKAIACAAGSGTYSCLITGINSNVIQNGTVANINVTLSSTATGSITIGVANTSGASLTGNAVGITGIAGTVLVLGGSNALLTAVKSHLGNFPAGQAGAAYTVVVMNALNAGSTTGTVTLNEIIPSGLTLVNMSGIGWNCAGSACTRSDLLNPGSSYPPITVVVNVAANPPVLVVNQVSVSGGGSPSTTSSDVTFLGSGCSYGISSVSASAPAAGASGTVSVTGPAGCPWTAVSGATWLTVTAGPWGSGNGTVTYTAAPNATVLWQTTTLTIAGQTFTLTQAPPVATNTEAFVRQLYLDLLSRTADPAGLSNWVNWINTGLYTRAQVASQFFQSQEFYGTGNYITKLYLGIMLRDPDYGGWFGWYNYLNAGYSQTDILNQFLLSQEFQSRYGNLDNTAFVTLAYNNVLNRPPDPAGLAQWVAWLNNGTYTRAQVMYGFITSQEFQLRVGNRVYADMLYIGFLRRAGDPNGLNGWNNWLTAGTYTLDQEVNGFITSPEYLARF